MSVARQLTLRLKLDSALSFDNFFTVEANLMAIAELRRQAAGQGEQWLYLHGPQGCSHLLQAVCNSAQAAGRMALYLPLKDVAAYSPVDVLSGLDAVDLICLDDIGAIAGKAEWEQALFNLYNLSLQTGVSILVADELPMSGLAFQLPDLISRLQSFSVLGIAPIKEEERKVALQFCAQKRGLEVSDQVADYLLSRTERDFASLLQLLDQLDGLSLQRKRKITIPLVKELLCC
ncbi:DnaA regulatory inactivator Hda [Spongiibacter sp. KMU-158]|uniref:DnaA regulatory inactivator Hda n=1 Tax=Spongiibacter pelagi TaxID=2760804 RepID=A0A927GVS4_9GAMM|nr:DnaA regulatory inactivator Hda [Spongiibacter pelagi]MBD2858393.1 DnaA regulatory inactivator Hda [Spongiibacter pelagi]